MTGSSRSARMKIAVIGGTGDLGMGLALRLAKTYRVTIGSRDPEKAAAAAAEAGAVAGVRIEARANNEAARTCDVAILAIPETSGDLLASIGPNLMEKLVISPIVPMVFEGGIFSVPVSAESAAERVAKALPMARVASAFHTVPAPKLTHLAEELDYDVLVAADSNKVFDEAAKIVSSVGKLRPRYAGPLVVSRMIEAITPALLNVSRFNRLKSPSIKLV